VNPRNPKSLACAAGFTLVAATLFAVSRPTPALACSVSSCVAEQLLPSGGSVPANVPGFLWHPGTVPEGKESIVTLTKLGAQGEKNVAVTVESVSEPNRLGGLTRILPSEPLEPLAQYVLSVPDYCSGQEGARRTSTITVTEAAPVPSSLGRLDIKQSAGTIEVAHTASCSAEVTASYADLTLQLSPEAAAYRGVLRYQTLADGKPAPVATGSKAPGAARLYVMCGKSVPGAMEGLPPGRHAVKVSALLPDGTRIDSEEVELELTCDTPSVPEAVVKPSGRCSVSAPGNSKVSWAWPLMSAALTLVLRRARRRKHA
jgi:hypothetical protein